MSDQRAFKGGNIIGEAQMSGVGGGGSGNASQRLVGKNDRESFYTKKRERGTSR